MTELELQELSKAVAAKYGIASYRYIVTGFTEDLHPKLTETWLHNDSGRCFDLAVEHGVDINIFDYKVVVTVWKLGRFFEEYVNHNNKQQAARVAVLKALLAKGE